MTLHLRFAFTVLSSLLFSSGCLSAPQDEVAEENASRGGSVSSTNRLSLNRLSLNRMSLNGLSSGALSQDGESLVESDLVADGAGRELLTYMVRCALLSDQELSATAPDGVTYTWKGLIGLAPTWLTSPLDSERSQRWVSACLLAHVNGYGIEVPISLRGLHHALRASEEEKATFTVQEAAFFGNVFDASEGEDDLGDPAFYSCGGSKLLTQCNGDLSSYRPQRSCADRMDCALKFAGTCKAPKTHVGNACQTSLSTGFRDCRPVLSDKSGHYPKGTPKYEEVITVWLQPESFNDLYHGCAPLPESVD
jgi:hypothetical protein